MPRHTRLVRTRLAQTAPVSPFAFDYDDPGNVRVDGSGRSPSRFVHVRSPRQAGLTAGNKRLFMRSFVASSSHPVLRWASP